MWANMKARFAIDGGRLRLERIDIDTDGAHDRRVRRRRPVALARQSYDVKSRVRLSAHARDLLQERDLGLCPATATSPARFICSRAATIWPARSRATSPASTTTASRRLHGSLHWTPQAASRSPTPGPTSSAATRRFDFSITPLGSPERPTARVRRAATPSVDRRAVLRLLRSCRACASPGRGRRGATCSSGRSGASASSRGDGELTVDCRRRAPSRCDASLAAARAADPDHSLHEWGPFAPVPLPAHLPIAGDGDVPLRSAIAIEVEAGRFATETHARRRSRARPRGATSSRFRFHVTSRDWQESDQVLAGILTDFGSRTGAGRVRRPRRVRRRDDRAVPPAARRRASSRGEDLRAWDTLWGDGDGAHRRREQLRHGRPTASSGSDDSEIRADGLFSLGYPAARRRRGDRRALPRHAVATSTACATRSSIDDYPVSGPADPASSTCTGGYRAPDRLRRDDDRRRRRVRRAVRAGRPRRCASTAPASASTASTSRRAAARITGAAFVGWDSTYSFNADGRRIPLRRASRRSPYPRAAAVGPRRVHRRRQRHVRRAPLRRAGSAINDLSVAAEGVGQVTGTLALRGERDQRRDRRRVAAARGDRHRAHRRSTPEPTTPS